MFVRAQVEFTRHDNATLIPLAALVKRDDQQGVFVADTDAMKARFVPVTTGIIDSETVEITEPPLAGSVITVGNHLLEHDASIVLPTEENAQTTKAPAQVTPGETQ
jgi:multidrug efflux pump subunit AcrA (membrane-fusion protein)